MPGSALEDLPEWRFSDERTLAIGTGRLEDPYLFHMIKDASRLESGETLVVDGRSKELRLFDESGEFLRKYGGEGEGPGEFPEILWDGVSPVQGTRVGVLSWPGRITVYDIEDGLVSTRRYPIQPFPGTTRTLSMEGDFFAEAVFIDGSIVAVGRFPWGIRHRQVFDELFTLPLRQLRYAVFRDSTYELLAELPMRQMVNYQPEPEGTMWRGGWWTEPLFSAREAAAFGSESLVLARTDRYELRHWRSTGEPIKTVRVLVEPEPVTEEILAPYRAWVDTARLSRDPAREYVDGLTAAGTVPFFSTIYLDREERIWVENYRADGFLRLPYPREWTVFSSAGRPVARIRESDSIRGRDILEIGRDSVLVLDEDDEGAEFIAEYRILSGGLE